MELGARSDFVRLAAGGGARARVCAGDVSSAVVTRLRPRRQWTADRDPATTSAPGRVARLADAGVCAEGRWKIGGQL